MLLTKEPNIYWNWRELLVVSYGKILKSLLLDWQLNPMVPISDLQSLSKVLGHFALLPTYGISVHLSLPTPNTVSMLIHPK